MEHTSRHYERELQELKEKVLPALDDELAVAPFEGVALQPLARLLGEMREQAGDRGYRESRERVAGRETDAERDDHRRKVRGDETSGAEQAEAHRVTIGIREE